MDKYQIILEELGSKISKHVHEELGKTTVRENMKSKFGKEAFLLPDEKKFPVINPDTGKKDCKLIMAAYVRAKQHNYPEVAAKAKSLYERNKCNEKIDMNIHESILEEIRKEDKFLYEYIARTEPQKTGHDPYTQYRGTLERREDTCICSACSYETPRSLDFPSCSMQECPLCGHKMKDNKPEKEKSLKESLEEIVEHPEDGKIVESRFICKNCDTLVTYEVKTNLDGHSPRCSDNLSLLRESVEFGKRHICNTCKSTYKYESAADPNICPVCNKYMTVFNENSSIPKSKTKPLSLK